MAADFKHIAILEALQRYYVIKLVQELTLTQMILLVSSCLGFNDRGTTTGVTGNIHTMFIDNYRKYTDN